jgi:putative ABC transport system permease protein
MMIGQGMGMVAIGVALGLVASLLVTRLLATLLYGVSTTDPVTFVAVPLVLVAVALLAAYLPVRRASRADSTPRAAAGRSGMAPRCGPGAG